MQTFFAPAPVRVSLDQIQTGSLFVCHSAPNQGRFALSWGQRITDYGTSKRGSPDLAGARLTNPAPQPLTGSLEAHVNQPSAPYTDPSLDIEYSLSLAELSCRRSRTSILSHLRAQKDLGTPVGCISCFSISRPPSSAGGIKNTWHYLRLLFEDNWGRTGANAELIFVS